MLFWIMLFIPIVVIGLTARVTDDGADTALAAFLSIVVSFFVIGLSVAFTQSKSTDAPHTETVKTYTLSDNSPLSNNSGKLKFVYTEDKTLKVYDETVKSVDIMSATGKTVEIHQTRYDFGTYLVPWGMDRVDTTAIVK